MGSRGIAVAAFVAAAGIAAACGCGGNKGQARRTRAKADLAALKTGAMIFMVTTSKLPEALADLERPIERMPEGIVKPVPNDPWGRPYLYKVLTPRTVLVSTLGADGQPGGQGEDEDLDSDHVDFK